MRCPYCGHNRDRVVDSRESRDGETIRRRRECLECSRRFTSYEQIEDIPYMVVKTDGNREEFSRQKLLGGLLRACEKRPVSITALEEATERIENKVLEKYDTEVPTSYLGQLVMEALKEIDQVAYVRFASVYREFQDITDFAAALKAMLPPGRGAKAKGGKSTKSRSKKNSGTRKRS